MWKPRIKSNSLSTIHIKENLARFTLLKQESEKENKKHFKNTLFINTKQYLTVQTTVKLNPTKFTDKIKFLQQITQAQKLKYPFLIQESLKPHNSFIPTHKYHNLPPKNVLTYLLASSCLSFHNAKKSCTLKRREEATQMSRD